jgi:hypothetical protein
MPKKNTATPNNCTKIFVVIMGVLTGLTGAMHGLAETMQGNKPTEGLVLAGIGAVTLIPNYLYTGIIAVLAGICIIIWTITSIHKKHGPAVYLALSVLLFLSGGGVALILGFLVTWTLATRIDKPLTWWRKVLDERSGKALSAMWKFSFISCFSALFIAMLIWAVLTPPGPSYKQPVYVYTCWSFLALSLIFLILTIITGFARDIENDRTGL